MHISSGNFCPAQSVVKSPSPKSSFFKHPYGHSDRWKKTTMCACKLSYVDLLDVTVYLAYWLDCRHSQIFVTKCNAKKIKDRIQVYPSFTMHCTKCQHITDATQMQGLALSCELALTRTSLCLKPLRGTIAHRRKASLTNHVNILSTVWKQPWLCLTTTFLLVPMFVIIKILCHGYH